jgi:hypothetical protein
MFHAPMGKFQLELIYFYYLFFHHRPTIEIGNKDKLILTFIPVGNFIKPRLSLHTDLFHSELLQTYDSHCLHYFQFVRQLLHCI